MAIKDSRRQAAEEAAFDPSNLAFIKYEDVDYKYFCDALPGTNKDDPEWRISRMEISTSNITWCDGNTNFDNIASTAVSVANLAYA